MKPLLLKGWYSKLLFDLPISNYPVCLLIYYVQGIHNQPDRRLKKCRNFLLLIYQFFFRKVAVIIAWKIIKQSIQNVWTNIAIINEEQPFVNFASNTVQDIRIVNRWENKIKNKNSIDKTKSYILLFYLYFNN